MIKDAIGVLSVALGVSTAGSEEIWIPFILMGIGMFLLRGLVEW